MRLNGMVLLAALLMASSLADLPIAHADDSTATRDAAIAADVAAVMAEQNIPGAQVAIVMPDGVIWERSFGVRDLATSAPMTSQTLIQVGSLTKIFTASLVADLVAEGALKWSDSLAMRLPGTAIRPDLADITLHELATHTARLPPNPPNRVDLDGIWQPYSVAALYASLVDPTVKRGAPGRTYSSWGYALLGHIVEQRAGKPFEDVLRERILAPLDMPNSKIALSRADEDRLAVHYWPEDKPLIARPHWKFGEVAGFGGMTSTASDLAKFLRYQIRPDQRADVLDAAEIQTLRTAQTVNASWQAGSARGWVVIREADGTIYIEHTGEVDGHSGYMGFSPENNVGVAVAANFGGSSSRAIGLSLLERVVAEARQLRPMNRETAMTLVRKRQFADAEVALVKVVTAVPDDGQAWHQLGVTRYELNDLPGAEAAWSQAVKKLDRPASSLFMLAVVAASQGRIDLAFERLNRALKAAEQTPDLATELVSDLERAELRILRSDRRWAKIPQRKKAAR